MKILTYRILIFLKHQVENNSKIANSVDNKNSKTSKFNVSKTLSEKRENILDIMIQIRLFLRFNIIINRVVRSFKIKVSVLIVT